jgi:lipoprotein NlpI
MSFRFLRACALAAPVCVSLVSHAEAQAFPLEQWMGQCAKFRLSGAIFSCTKIIEWAREHRETPLGDEAVFAFHWRSVAYLVRGNLHQAIEDVDRAISISSRTATLYNSRGVIWRQAGLLEAAIRDYDRSIELDRSRAEVYENRGIAYFLLSNFPASVDDLTRAIALYRNRYRGGSMTALHLHIARVRAGKADIGALPTEVQHLDTKKWPGLLVAFYSGRVSEGELRAAVKPPDTRDGVLLSEHDEPCEMAYFVGQYKLLRADRAGAMSLFQEAADVCLDYGEEQALAKNELKRASPGQGN